MSPSAKPPFLKDGVVLNGKWEIIEHIATGGKGEVYLARQTSLQREVVVKTIRLEYLAELEGDTEEIETEVSRFHREAMALAQIRHPFIVQVFDQDSAVVGTENGDETIQYLVMEYVPGPTLREVMPEEGFCTDEKGAQTWLREYFLPILDGIEAFHDLGIVHRDVKPENVLLQGSTPKITDFGIAGGVGWSELTKSHHVEGTITYMAPEQFMDLGETDVRGDVYALGKILYEAVIGKMDKTTAAPLKGVSLHCTDTPFLRGLDRIVRDATAEEKELRIPSVKALRERLENLLEEFDESKFRFMGVSLPRPGPKGIMLAVALVAFVIGLIVVSNLLHHAFMVAQTNHSRESLVGSASDPPQAEGEGIRQPSGQGTDLPSKVIGQDGPVLRLIPARDVTLPLLLGSGTDKPIHVLPFYLGETEVTNAQYVRFLNQVLDRIAVVNDEVQSNGTTWLVLKEVFGGHEPIVFENGAFSVKEPRYRSYPVVRVTGAGAAAYARFYGATLPTELQWYVAARSDKRFSGHRRENGSTPGRDVADLEREMNGLVEAYGVLDKVETGSSRDLGRPSRIPYNVFKFRPNEYGIRGLRANIGEWGLRSLTGGEHTKAGSDYVILGALEGTWLLGSTLIRGPEQDSAQAHAWVGFRIAQETDRGTPAQEWKDVHRK